MRWAYAAFINGHGRQGRRCRATPATHYGAELLLAQMSKRRTRKRRTVAEEKAGRGGDNGWTGMNECVMEKGLLD